MAITLRSITTPAVDTSTPYTVAKPAGTLEGDFLLASVIGSSTTLEQVLPPSGWYAVQGAGLNGSDNISLWYKIAGASEPASYNFTSSSGSTSVGIGIMALYGSGPIKIDAVATQYNASSTNRTYPSVTMSGAGFLVCMGSGSNSFTSTPPGDMIEQWDATISSNKSYAMTRTISSAGATGTKVATGTAQITKCITVGLIEDTTTYPGIRRRSHTSTGPTTTSPSLTLAMPSDIAVGDMLVAQFVLASDRTVTTPTGWTLRANLASTGAMRVFTKVAEAGDTGGANLTVSFSGASLAVSLAVTAFYSPDGHDLTIGDIQTASLSATATITFPSVTSTQDGSVLAMLTSKAQTTQYSLDTNINMWKRYDFGATAIRTALFTEYLLAIGATGTRTAANSSGTHPADVVSMLIEIAPEVVVEVNNPPLINYARDLVAEGTGNRSVASTNQPFSPQPSKLRPVTVNYGNRRNHTVLPDEVTGYALDDPDSFWSVVIPEATENLVENPSFERYADETNGYALSGWSATSVPTEQVTAGRFSLKLVSNGVTASVTYTVPTTLTAGTAYTWSLDWYGRIGESYTALIEDDNGVDIYTKTFKATSNGWARYSFSFTPRSGLDLSGVDLKFSIASTVPAGKTFYTDRWQLEAKAYPTTYCDGDMQGHPEDPNPHAYAWTGKAHASTSVRSATTTTGGKIVSLAAFGFKTVTIQGLGMPDSEIVSYGIRQPGDILKSITPSNREFTLTGKVFGKNERELSEKKQGIINALRPRWLEVAQPIRLYYQPVNMKGVKYGKALYIDCVCRSGLSGNMTNLYQETLSLQMTAYSPKLYEETMGIDTIDAPMLGTGTGYAERDRNHNWDDKGASTSNGSIDAVAFDETGMPWVGGTFSQFNGLSILRIARLDKATNVWTQIGDGLAGPVIGLGLSNHPQFPIMGIVGSFVDSGLDSVYRAGYYDGTNDVQMMATGLSDAANCIATYNRSFYIGGDFINDQPLGESLLYVARYASVTDDWHPVATGLNGSVKCVTVGKDGMIYFGGAFTTSGGGGTSLGRVAKYNPTTDAWIQLDDGLNSTVHALAFGPDGYLYAGGAFTQDAGGTRSIRYIARWNGRSWEEVGGGLNATVYGLTTVGKYLYVSGSFTAGANGYPSWAQNYITRWDGNQWVPSDYSTDNASSIARLAVAPDGRVGLVAASSYSNNWASLSGTVTNTGTAEAPVTILLAEEAFYYEITNITTGQSIFFKKLETFSGEQCVLDFTGVTPRFYSNLRDDLTPYILISASNYRDFRLAQGDNVIKIMAKDSGSLAQVTTIIRWQNAHWSYDVAGDR